MSISEQHTIYSSLNGIFCSNPHHRKKILALVLAFACAFTMFAGAAFTDQADINADNAEAVDLLTTLNIIGGYPDGTFDPEGTVDRAEMAKMIYTIRNGGNDDASAHVDNTTSFTDINGHWAEGYIKYLQNTGIVAGKSATTFDPDSPVTTTEAMKMALALAGYDEKNAELTGPNWSKNTLTLATTIGLTDNVSSAMNAGCTRQDAAQILANVLEATAVRYSAIVENFVNDSKTGLSYGGDPITVGYKWMDLTVYVGRMVSSGDLNIDGAANAGKDRFSVVVDTVNGVDATSWTWDDWSNNWVSRTRTLTVKDGQDHTDLVGMEVKLLAGDKSDEVYGVYATGTSQVVESTMDQIDVVNASRNTADLKIDGETYDTDGAAVYADLEPAASVLGVFTNNGEAVADAVKLIDWDNDGDYETILVNTVAVAEVSYVGTSSVTLGTYGSRDRDILKNDLVLDIDDNTIYEGITKDDYAVVTKNTYDDSWIVEKAETVSGEVNGRVANERKVCIDDVWYTLANNKNGVDTDDLYTLNGTRSDLENGDDIMLVIVGNIAYYAESISGNDANRTVAMVYDTGVDVGLWNDTYQAKIILANGDKLTVDVDKIITHAAGEKNPVDIAGGTVKDAEGNYPDGKIDNLTPGKLYYYDINNDDEYTFIELGTGANQEDAGYDVVANNTTGIQDGDYVETTTGARYTIANEAIVFAYIADKDDAEVYSGEALKNANVNDNWGRTVNGQVLADNNSGFTYARMLNVKIDDSQKFNNITNYGYMVTDSVWMTRDGVRVMRYTYWNGEEVVTSYEKTNNNREKDIQKGTIIGFALGEDDWITDVEYANTTNNGRKNNELDLTYAAMTGYDADYIGVKDLGGTDHTWSHDGDTLAYYVNSDAKTEDIGATGSGLNYDVDADEYGRYPVNIAYVLGDDDKTIKFIVIDVDADLLDGTYVGGRTPDDEGETEEPTASDTLYDPSQKDINDAFAEYDVVTVSGEMPKTIRVDADKKLVIEDAYLDQDLRITGAGTVEIIDLDADGNDITANDATLDLTEGGSIDNKGTVVKFKNVVDNSNDVDDARITELLGYSNTVEVSKATFSDTTTPVSVGAGETLNIGTMVVTNAGAIPTKTDTGAIEADSIDASTVDEGTSKVNTLLGYSDTVEFGVATGAAVGINVGAHQTLTVENLDLTNNQAVNVVATGKLYIGAAWNRITSIDGGIVVTDGGKVYANGTEWMTDIYDGNITIKLTNGMNDVTLNGNATLLRSAEINGKLTTGSNTLTVPADMTLTLSAVTVDKVANIKGAAEGATLVIGNGVTNTADDNAVYATRGSAGKIAANTTYTWDLNADNASGAGWLAQA